MFETKTYDDPQVFWKEVAPQLLQEEAKNCMCLGLSHIFKSDARDCLFLGALFENENLLGSLVGSRHISNHNLLLSFMREANDAERLFELIQRNKIEFHGVVGETRTAEMFRKLFHAAGRQTKTLMEQGIYRCAKVNLPPTLSSRLRLRVATLNDVKKVAEWVDCFRSEAVPHDPPMDTRAFAKSRIEKGVIHILERDKTPVSMAAFGRDIGTSCAVNLVFTPKSLRKQGLGSAITALLTDKLLKEGRKETNLFTDMSNPTSNKIYQNVGYEFVCNSIHFSVT